MPGTFGLVREESALVETAMPRKMHKYLDAQSELTLIAFKLQIFSDLEY